ncbi:ABC transporter substrate-binding protein [Subdoligranulum sp. AF14-43]|nr:ABC transporter substrate-binding protein [Subdoligranulum sp. AF14-43]
MQIYKRAKIVYNIVSLRSASDQFIKQEETKMNKMRFHKVLSLVLVLVLAGSILAGCGNSNSTPASGAASTGGSQGTQGSQAKDSLNVVTYADPIGVFPLHVDYGADKTRDGVFFQQVYDTLFRLDAEGNPEPWLATEYEVSEDGLEWTFTLRDDVYFHNGEKMTAEDVVFSWETALAENPTAATSMLNGLAAGEVIDDTHVKATLSHVSPAFLNMLCTQMGVIINKAYYEEVGGAEGYAAHPVGTGAYKFVSRTSGEKIVLEANEDYWAGAPAIKNVQISIISNISTQFLSLESGDADVVINADLSSCTKLQENSPVTWDSTGSTTRTLISFGWTKDYIRDDLNLRMAIQSAIRKEDLLAGVLFGQGKILDIDVVTGFPTSPDEGTYTVIPYDQEAAKEYLAKSNYDGRELEIYVITGSTCEKAAQIIQGQLAEVGIKVAVVPCDNATFSSAQRNASADMNISDNTNVWFDFCNPGASYNPDMETTFKHEEYFKDVDVIKDYYAKIAIEQDPAVRKQLMADLMSFGVENAYQIPLYASVNAIAYNKNLQGVAASPVSDFYIHKLSWS